MADKDYLENWRELYSYPNHITSNEYLTEDGYQSANSQDDWTYAQEHILLKGSAIGTAKNDFLDPIPLFNKLGHIYTNIINSYFTSARTDAIKVGLKNMDFTNGRSLEDMSVESIPLYDFFNFYDFVGDDINHKNLYNPSTQSDNTNGNAIASMRQRLKIYETDEDGYYDKFCVIDENFFNSIVRFKYGTPVYIKDELAKYTNWYSSKKDEIMDVFSKIKDLKWEQYWTKIQYTYTTDNVEYTNTYFVPSIQYISVWLLYCGALNGTQKGLQLLMPQYKRRVEVEDLDKNFWVISQILDAVVNALWGPHGLINVVRRLILKVTQIEKFLGLDNVQNIELWHSGNNDMYFDMYSRFTLSGLELKLKGANGERTIKNIFSPHTESSDRNSTTDSYLKKEHLFYGIQTNEIAKDKKIYDSDLISSCDTIETTNGKGYISLSSVIDAINGKIVGNENIFGTYSYENESDLVVDFFSKLDANSDGKYTPAELEKLASDQIISEGEVFSTNELKNMKKYENAYNFLKERWDIYCSPDVEEKQKQELKVFFDEMKIESVEDIDKLFKKRTVLSNVIVDTDSEAVLSLLKDRLDKYKSQIADTINFWSVKTDDDTTDNSGTKYTPSNLKDLTESVVIELKTLNTINNDTSADSTDEDSADEQNKNELWNFFKNIEVQTKELCLYGYEETPSTNENHFLKVVYKKVPTGLLWPTYWNGSGFGKSLNLLHLGDEADFTTWLNMVKAKFSRDILSKAENLKITGLELSAQKRGIQSTKSAYYNFLKEIREIDIRKVDSGEELTQDQINDQKEAQATAMSLVENWIEKVVYDDCYIYIGDFDAIGLLPSEDVYVHSFTSAQYLAKYLAGNNAIGNAFANDSDIAKEFFNVSKYDPYRTEDIKDTEKLNVYDCVMMARQYSYESNGKYNLEVKKLINKIKTGENNFLNKVRALIAPHFKTTNSSTGNDITPDNIINAFFTLKKAGSSTLLSDFEIYTPTIYLLILITQLQNVSKLASGFELTEEDKGYLIKSIENTQYKLQDNILVFLYDKDYYDFKLDKGTTLVYAAEETSKDGDSYYINIYKENGLYVKATDGFYNTKQPLIQYSMFFDGSEDNTYALFIPREDLINGEIIQLRLTQKNASTKKMLDFKSFNSQYGFNGSEGKGVFKETGSKLFLSLHNCFSTIETQYNHRTALFFEDTTPEDITFLTSVSEDKKLSVDDWFVNGIECQYFRPTEVATDTGRVTDSLQYKKKDLKIRASMLSKNEPFNDNSFYYNTIVEFDNKDEFINGDNNVDDNNINNNFFNFSRELAYCAAQRHNLLFYSSPSTNEQNMYIHSPLQLLQTPYTRTDDSIQSPSWTKGKLTSSCFDVLREAGETCGTADIKNMLYKNSKVGKYNIPQCIEAIWGSRKVDDYVKKKKLQYIIIEREPGSRNNTYGPTTVGVSYGHGYLHETITSFGETGHNDINCQVKWYAANGEPLGYIEKNGDHFPDPKAKYGVIDLTGVKGPIQKYANAYFIRFYAGDPEKIYLNDKANVRIADEFSFKYDGKTRVRRPIFRMAYFFGIDETGRKISGSTGSANQYS